MPLSSVSPGTSESPVPIKRPNLRLRSVANSSGLSASSSGTRCDAVEQTFDVARQQFGSGLSLMRAAVLLVEIDSGQRVYDEQEVIERAFSSGGFVFGAVIHLQMLASYAEKPLFSMGFELT